MIVHTCRIPGVSTIRNFDEIVTGAVRYENV
jgi:hypothetical protein